ncbi:MAG: hypothetical protein ACHQHN_11835 [Sphingobacteriales bacterium]
MKKLTWFSMILILFCCAKVSAQYSGSFVVQGSLTMFYPVIFQDASWYNNKATEFELGRSNVHTDSLWRGSLIAKFRFHTTNYGHGSNFIDANIYEYPGNSTLFVAGWQDGTINNGNAVIIVWLRGGTSTYYYNSAVNINPVVYDGVQNALPYQETNGPALSYKTGIDPYVNSAGQTEAGSAYFTGPGDNYFAGYVGIGTSNPDALLSVAGTIHSEQVKVDLNGWSDYVFNPGYILKPLSEVKAYIDQNRHLPEMPPERVMIKNGLNVGEMNKLLVKKVEELTLYLIEQSKLIAEQNKRIERLEQRSKH